MDGETPLCIQKVSNHCRWKAFGVTLSTLILEWCQALDQIQQAWTCYDLD